MENKKTFSLLMTFGLTLILFASTVFAWITLREQARIDDFVLNVNDLKSEIKLEVKKNNNDFQELITEEDFEIMFHNSVPSDRFLFRLTLNNASTRETSIRVVLNNISNTNDYLEYDMRNVFYIEGGIVSINGKNDFQDPLPVNNLELEPVFGQELNLYNLNNLLVNNNIVLVDNYSLELDGALVLEFTLVYDKLTSEVGYQSGKLGIGGIYIYNK